MIAAFCRGPFSIMTKSAAAGRVSGASASRSSTVSQTGLGASQDGGPPGRAMRHACRGGRISGSAAFASASQRDEEAPRQLNFAASTSGVPTARENPQAGPVWPRAGETSAGVGLTVPSGIAEERGDDGERSLRRGRTRLTSAGCFPQQRDCQPGDRGKSIVYEPPQISSTSVEKPARFFQADPAVPQRSGSADGQEPAEFILPLPPAST